MSPTDNSNPPSDDIMDRFKNLDLINHVWRKCLQSSETQALFHGDTLAKTFLDQNADWIDAWKQLRGFPEIAMRTRYIDINGIKEKIFEARIDPIYRNPKFQEILKTLARRDLEIIKQRKGELR